MQNMELEALVARFMALAPSFLVMLIGAVLAFQRLPKYPRPCWVLLAALAIDGGSNLVLPIIMQTLMNFLFAGSVNPGQSRILWSFIWTLPYGLVNALVWGLVLFAVFDRPDQPKFLVDDDLDRDILDR